MHPPAGSSRPLAVTLFASVLMLLVACGGRQGRGARTVPAPTGQAAVALTPAPGSALSARESDSQPATTDAPAQQPPTASAGPQQNAAAQPAATPSACVPAVSSAGITGAALQRAYGVDRLLAQGTDGSGQTVVIVDSFGDPTLERDLAVFSEKNCLPDADVQQLYPLGTDFQEQSANDTAGWAGETALDAEMVHAIAPRARIVVLVSPVSETEGVQGMPEFLALERYALDNQLGSVISQSWGTSENWLEDADGAALRAEFDAFYQQATAAGITIITSSGDHGALADTADGDAADFRSADWPAAVPWITTVGGTVLSRNADGGYASESVWRGSGSGVSRFYPQPAAQAALPDALQQQLQGMRGEADVSAVASGLVVWRAGCDGCNARSGLVGGTSAAAPIWAGIVALASQQAGHGLGNINPTVYALGAAGRCFHDVTSGRNAVGGDAGEPALPGWDFPTGWGTPDAPCLVPALAAGAGG